MKTFSHLKIVVGASCALTLGACDSIKDVPNEDAGSLPPQTVVLSGQIYGLSSLRAITLQNNDDTINTKSFINAAPSVANEGIRPVPFSFGTFPAGSEYNITVKANPEFKNCTVTNGEGVLAAGVQPNVVVTCVNTGTRHDLTVNIPSNAAYFKGLAGAKVRVTTEEEIREVAVTAASPNAVVFEDVLVTAPGALNPAVYSVTASTFEGNRLNKCVVTLPTGTNPTGPVSNVVVGAVATAGSTPLSVDALAPACQFTVGGSIGYSLPPGETTIPAIAGLTLQLRDLQENALDEFEVTNCTPAATTGTTNVTTTLAATVPVPSTVGAGCAYTFNTPVRSSSTDGVYEVAVLEHPVGQHCIVTNGGSVSVFTQGLTPPVNVTNANVFCRATPAANKQLHGVFRLQSTTYVASVGATPMTATWDPFNLTKQNVASSNMIAFFNNGTFLHGTHGNGAQVEHGFYDYADPDANPATADGTVRFTSIVDTNTGTVFPANFSGVPINSKTSTSPTTINHLTVTTNGLSALPNPIRRNGAAAPDSTVTGFANLHAAMTGVMMGTVQRELDVGVTANVRTISGTFGADAAGLASNSPSSTARVSWVLEEPPQVDGEMTGAWLKQDSRRLWVWDYRTYYGTGVGVTGGSPSMNDACFTMEDLHQSTGIYTRRGSGTGCFPFARPGNDPTSGLPGLSLFDFATFTFTITPRNGEWPAYQSGTAESVDFSLSNTPLVQLPGYTGRHPGGEPAPGNISPSPIYFHVAPAASFFTSANATYFPTASASWCTTEILGLRATANGFPINTPIYYCRTRSN